MYNARAHLFSLKTPPAKVGNVTKANTKGFSVGSASLACFLLFSAFMDEVGVYAKTEFKVTPLVP